MSKWIATLLALLGLALCAAPASAATGFERVGAFAETAADGTPARNQRIAVNHASGDIYKTDVVAEQIVVYRGTTELTTFGAGQLEDPYGIAIDQTDGSVYVSDAGNDRIVKYASDGAPTPAFTVDGGFTSPPAGPGAAAIRSFAAALAVDPVSGKLLVADPGSNLVKRFTAAGAYDALAIDGSGSAATFTGLHDVAVDSTGDVIVVDTTGNIARQEGHSRVERFAADGTWEAAIGPLFRAAVVAVRPADDSVIVSANQDAVYLNAKPTVTVFDAAGARVSELVLDNSVLYSTITGLAVDDGAAGRLHVATDADRSAYNSVYGHSSLQAYDPAPLAAVSAGAATGVGAFSATLHGTVDPDGSATTYQFQYSTNGHTWTAAGAAQDAGSGTGAVAVQASATGLADGTLHRVRLAATRAGVITYSAEQTFTTVDADPPAVTADPATAITGTGATLNATINPQGHPTAWRFEYSADGGTTWIETSGGDAGGNAPLPVQVSITGLQPFSAHQFRIVATNGAGTSTSSVATFSTLPAPPAVTTLDAGDITGSTAKLTGSVDPQGQPTTYWFEYGPTAAYGTSVPVAEDAVAGDGNDPVPVFRRIAGLTPGTIYHVRLVAVNATGTTHGIDRTFRAARLGSGDPSAPVALPGTIPGKGFLPDDRGWEKVSPAVKGDSDLNFGAGSVMAAADGSRLAYRALTAPPGSVANHLQTQYVSVRDGAGAWRHQNVLAPMPPHVGMAQIGNMIGYRLFTPDLSAGVFLGAPQNGSTVFNVYRRTFDTGAIDRITPERLDAGPAGALWYAQTVADMTPDGSRILLESRYRLTPEAPADQVNVYEWAGGQLRLVNILPDGTPSTRAVAGRGRHGGVATTSDQGSTPTPGTITPDGARIFFTVAGVPNAYGNAGDLYVRENGTTTRRIDASQRAVPDPDGPKESEFMGASRDGRIVVFMSCEKLTDGAPHGDRPGQPCSAASGGYANLYRYDLETEELTSFPATAESPDRTQLAVGISDDGEVIHYLGQDGRIYRWTGGDVVPVGYGSPDASPARLGGRDSEVSPDGRFVVFRSSTPQAGADVGRTAEDFGLFLYDAVEDELTCISCDEDGRSGTQSALRSSYQYTPGYSNGLVSTNDQTTNIDSAGQHVYFMTQSPLVDGDVNGKTDVYQYDIATGKHALISSGTGAAHAFFGDISDDGSSVFFATGQRIVAADRDELVDLYVARVGGGVPEPVEVAPCEGDRCQGTVSTPVAGADPATDAAGTDAPAAKRPRARLRRVPATARAALAARGRATLTATVATAGRVTLVARAKLGGRTVTVARAARSASRSGPVKLQLRLSRAARGALSRKGTLRLELAVASAGQLTPHRVVVNLKKGR